MTGLEVIGAEEPRREREPQGLRLWAEEMTSAAQIARGIAGTPFVPSALRVFTRGEPDLGATTANVAAALLAGRELGLEPMAALRSIHIIDGTPGLSALAVRALVVAAGHDMWLEQSSRDGRCGAGPAPRIQPGAGVALDDGPGGEARAHVP
jgi:hypothetical protein